MKIRTGFVSNSSSSSFVLIVKKEKHDELIKSLPEFHQDVLKALGKTQTVFGNKCFVIGDMSDAGGMHAVLPEESWIPEKWQEKIEQLEEEENDDELEKHDPLGAIYDYSEEVHDKLKKEDYYRWNLNIG